MSHCYYQVRIFASNRRFLRFKVVIGGQTKFFEWLTLSMGLSQSSIIVNSFTSKLVEIFSVKFDLYGKSYSDDIWQESSVLGHNFDDFGRRFGLIFNDRKTEEGPVVDLLGVGVDLRVDVRGLITSFY